MKRLMTATLGLGAVLGAALMATSVSAEDQLEIRWGTSPGYKPFIYKTEDGQLTGFDYEIGAALCAELNAECTWVEQAWDGIIPGLQANNYDAILASMSITEERKKVIDFTIPYQAAPTVFIAKDGVELNDAYESGLEGVTIGTQAGTVQHKFLEAKYPNAEIKTYPAQDEVWLDLKSGRIDATFVGAPQAESWLKSDDGAGFGLSGTEHESEEFFGIGAGIGVRQGEEELRDKISEAIRAIEASGEYKKINDRYFETNIYPATN